MRTVAMKPNINQDLVFGEALTLSLKECLQTAKTFHKEGPRLHLRALIINMDETALVYPTAVVTRPSGQRSQGSGEPAA